MKAHGIFNAHLNVMSKQLHKILSGNDTTDRDVLKKHATI